MSDPVRTDHLLSALGDPLRRRIYEYVQRSDRSVTRDDVARDHGISKSLAAFHLERLLHAGALTASFARPGGRSGPGAGRTAKFYEATHSELRISLPERRYDFVGRLLVEAIESESLAAPAGPAAIRLATRAGRHLGDKVRRERRIRRASAGAYAALFEILGDHGFEPYRDPSGRIRLGNCPFHRLARQAPDLICGINHAFTGGLLDGLGIPSGYAVLVPGAACCVCVLAPRDARAGAAATPPGEGADGAP